MNITQILQLPRGRLRTIFGSPTYSRGLNYYREGRVLDLEWLEEEGVEFLISDITGSGFIPYTVEVIASDDQEIGFDTLCTCPVEHFCKHAVALLLSAADTFDLPALEQEAKASPLDRWLGGLNDRMLTSHNPPPIDQPLDFVAYQLSLIHGRKERQLKIEALRTRRLKRGGLGKPQAVSFARLGEPDYYFRPAYISEEDVTLARLAHSLDLRLVRLDVVVSGEGAEFLLRRLLRTGRCYFDSLDHEPLRLGPTLKAHFSWVEQTKEESQLLVELEGCAEWLLLPTDPPWYLDPTTQQCGPIQQPMQTTLFSSLLSLPALGVADQQRFCQELMPLLPAEVPLPQEVEFETIEAELVPELRLFGISIPGSGERMPLLELRFCYGDHCLVPNPDGPILRTQLFEAGKNLIIQHQIEAETDAINRLFALDFSPMDASPFGLEERLILSATIDEGEGQAYFQRWRLLHALLPELEQEGWRIIHDDAEPGVHFTAVSSASASVNESSNDWFEIGMNIELDGDQVPLLPLLSHALGSIHSLKPDADLVVPLSDGRWLTIDPALIRPLLDTLLELYDGPLNDEGVLRLPRTQAGVLDQLNERIGSDRLGWNGGQRMRELGQRLRNFSGIEAVAPPAGLDATLRDYQLQGLAWLNFLREYGFAGVLADDMGLGKTLQTLALLLLEKQAGRLDRPALVVCPTSLLGNWRREALRFAPALRVLEWHGPKRSHKLEQLTGHDLIITNYPLLAREHKFLATLPLHYLICDEAQTLKNPTSQAAMAARSIDTRHRLCLTGTPLENHLGELWALFDLLMPGFLWDQRKFNTLLRHPIEKQGLRDRQQQLNRRVAPFMLRRTKGEVASELPPKSEIIRLVELGPEQRRLYETIRVAMAEKVQKLLATKGLKRSRIEILDALLKLRQVCCDPRLVKMASARKVNHSAKLELLMEMLPEMLEEGRKILLFSQFTSMLGLIESELNKAGIDYTKLTGQTRKRDAAIQRFVSGEVSLFLISLKAGGTGLNLTEADTVIHYDPWWNPAVEAQATDRAHRIGQDKPVFVYKLLVEETLEEKMLGMQQRKQALADALYAQDEDAGEFKLDVEAMLGLFAE